MTDAEWARWKDETWERATAAHAAGNASADLGMGAGHNDDGHDADEERVHLASWMEQEHAEFLQPHPDAPAASLSPATRRRLVALWYAPTRQRPTQPKSQTEGRVPPPSTSTKPRPIPRNAKRAGGHIRPIPDAPHHRPVDTVADAPSRQIAEHRARVKAVYVGDGGERQLAEHRARVRAVNGIDAAAREIAAHQVRAAGFRTHDGDSAELSVLPPGMSDV